MRSVSIINRSEWPTWLIRWFVQRSAADAGITWAYQWTQKSHRGSYYGRGWRHKGHGGVVRRYIPPRPDAEHVIKDPRFKTDDAFPIPHSPVAVLAFLIRHEVEHAVDGHPSEFRERSRTRRYDMEYICNGTASEWVCSLKEKWPEIFKEWRRLARADREKNRAPLPFERSLARFKKKADLLKKWERKLKIAQTKVKKLKKSIKAFETRHAATTGRA